MEHALGNDQIYNARIGFRFNQAFDKDMLLHNASVKASTEVASNYTDSKYLKSKFFARYMTSYKKALIHTSLSGGYMKPLNGMTA